MLLKQRGIYRIEAVFVHIVTTYLQYNCYFRFGACVGVVFTAAILCFMNSYDAEFVFDDSEAIINNQVQISVHSFDI